MKANQLQRSGDSMSVSANHAWIGGPITSSMQVRPDGLRTVGRTPQSRPAVPVPPVCRHEEGAAVGGAFTGTVGAARAEMPAQALAPARTDAAATGAAVSASERPRIQTVTSRAVTSARAIMTSAAVQAAGPVMWCAMLKAAMAGPAGP